MADPATARRASPAGQSVLSGRASMALAHGAIPLPTTDLPDGKWVIVSSARTEHYTDTHGTKRHYNVDQQHILIGIQPALTFVEEVVNKAIEKHLGDVVRWLQRAGRLPLAVGTSRFDISGQELYDHLCLQRRELFGGWMEHPREPDWLTAWRVAGGSLALAGADAGATLSVKARQGRLPRRDAPS